MAEPGAYFVVEYEGFEGMYHERLVLARLGPDQPAGSYYILTPDGEKYVEQISALADDLSDFHLLRRQGEIPPGLDLEEDDFHRFEDPPVGVRLQDLFREAAIAVGMPAPAPPAPPRPAGVVARAAPAGALVQDGFVWIALEDRGEIERGNVVREVPAAAEIRGHLGFFPDGAGGLVARRLIAQRDVATYVHDDLRVLAVEEEAGRRHRPFGSAVGALIVDPPEGGLGLEGPACTHEKCIAVRDSAGNFTASHQLWTQASRIPDGDRALYEHEVLCRALDAMLQFDQLNLPALRSAEILIRRVMLLEEAYSLCPSAPDFSGADFFMGWTALGSGGSGAISTMRAHVAEQLRGRAAVAKEQRKAREELQSKRGLKKKNKGDGKGDKQKDE